MFWLSKKSILVAAIKRYDLEAFTVLVKELAGTQDYLVNLKLNFEAKTGFFSFA